MKKAEKDKNNDILQKKKIELIELVNSTIQKTLVIKNQVQLAAYMIAESNKDELIQEVDENMLSEHLTTVQRDRYVGKKASSLTGKKGIEHLQVLIDLIRKAEQRAKGIKHNHQSNEKMPDEPRRNDSDWNDLVTETFTSNPLYPAIAISPSFLAEQEALQGFNVIQFYQAIPPAQWWGIMNGLGVEHKTHFNNAEERIIQALEHNRYSPIACIIKGNGGFGKTTLARQLAVRFTLDEEFRKAGKQVWWLNPETTSSELKTFIERLGNLKQVNGLLFIDDWLKIESSSDRDDIIKILEKSALDNPKHLRIVFTCRDLEERDPNWNYCIDLSTANAEQKQFNIDLLTLACGHVQIPVSQDLLRIAEKCNPFQLLFIAFRSTNAAWLKNDETLTPEQIFREIIHSDFVRMRKNLELYRLVDITIFLAECIVRKIPLEENVCLTLISNFCNLTAPTDNTDLQIYSKQDYILPYYCHTYTSSIKRNYSNDSIDNSIEEGCHLMRFHHDLLCEEVIKLRSVFTNLIPFFTISKYIMDSTYSFTASELIVREFNRWLVTDKLTKEYWITCINNQLINRNSFGAYLELLSRHELFPNWADVKESVKLFIANKWEDLDMFHKMLTQHHIGIAVDIDYFIIQINKAAKIVGWLKKTTLANVFLFRISSFINYILDYVNMFTVFSWNKQIRVSIAPPFEPEYIPFRKIEDSIVSKMIVSVLNHRLNKQVNDISSDEAKNILLNVNIAGAVRISYLKYLKHRSANKFLSIIDAVIYNYRNNIINKLYRDDVGLIWYFIDNYRQLPVVEDFIQSSSENGDGLITSIIYISRFKRTYSNTALKSYTYIHYSSAPNFYYSKDTKLYIWHFLHICSQESRLGGCAFKFWALCFDFIYHFKDCLYAQDGATEGLVLAIRWSLYEMQFDKQGFHISRMIIESHEIKESIPQLYIDALSLIKEGIIERIRIVKLKEDIISFLNK